MRAIVKNPDTVKQARLLASRRLIEASGCPPTVRGVSASPIGFKRHDTFPSRGGKTRVEFTLQPSYPVSDYPSREKDGRDPSDIDVCRRISLSYFSNARRINATCYHGHFAVLAVLFRLEPDAKVITTMATYQGEDDFYRKAYALAGRNIGSRMFPMSMDQACRCPGSVVEESMRDLRGEADGGWEKAPPVQTVKRDESESTIRFASVGLAGDKLVESNVRLIKHSDIARCRFSILVPEHYRNDGSCKCDDPEHRRMMCKSEEDGGWGYSEWDFAGIPLRPRASAEVGR